MYPIFQIKTKSKLIAMANLKTKNYSYLMWMVNLSFLANALPHTVHSNAFDDEAVQIQKCLLLIVQQQKQKWHSWLQWTAYFSAVCVNFVKPVEPVAVPWVGWPGALTRLRCRVQWRVLNLAVEHLAVCLAMTSCPNFAKLERHFRSPCLRLAP